MSRCVKLATASLLFVLVALVCADGVHAQPRTDVESSGSITGSVGTLIGAAMQTAGTYAQAKVLVNFKEGLKTLAALCYLCSIIGAIFSLSIFGNYSKALYFLIGPPLFYLMINVTSTVDGANQKVGGDLRGSLGDQKRFLREFVHTADYSSAEVSMFFVMWDRLVSSVMQGVVEQIVRNKEDIEAKAREHYYSFLINFQPPEVGYQRLVNQSLMGTCGKIFNNLWEARRYRRDPTNRELNGNLLPEGERLILKYTEQKDLPQVPLSPDSLLAEGMKLPQVIREPKKYSCAELWKAVEIASKDYAQHLLSEPEIYFDYTTDQAGIPYDRVRADVERALAQEGHGSAVDILAGMILRNTMRDNHINAIYSNINDRTPDNRTSETLTFQQANIGAAQGNIMRIAQFAKAVPYVQGLMLYILSIAFPFFAVFLVMPGRARSFLIWMSLWVWLKSWDVGFALVSTARKLMWNFVRAGVDQYAPNNVFAPHTRPQLTFNWDQPETILAVIFDNDPNVTFTIYTTVITVMTVAVPLLSAHFCLGATNMFGAFSGALDGVANKWGTQRRKMVHRRAVGSPMEQLRDEYAGANKAVSNVKAVTDFTSRGRVSGGPTRRPPANSSGNTPKSTPPSANKKP